MLHIQKRNATLGKSRLKKQLVAVHGRETSVSVEQPFWDGMKEIAGANKISLRALVSKIDAAREHANLSSAIRLFVLNYYRDRVDPSQRGL